MPTYINASAKEFGNYGSINLSFKLEDLKEHTNDKGYINLVLQKRKEVGRYGDTHSIILNEYKPEAKKETKYNTQEIDLNNIPF